MALSRRYADVYDSGCLEAPACRVPAISRPVRQQAANRKPQPAGSFYDGA